MIGPDYIELAFRWAHEAEPAAKLTYNDHFAEGFNAKSNAVYAMVQDLQKQGVPIDGVGLHSHFSLADPPRVDDIASNVARLGALGLEVHISEPDVRIQQPFTDEKLSQQADRLSSPHRPPLRLPRTVVVTWFCDSYGYGIPSGCEEKTSADAVFVEVFVFGCASAHPGDTAVS